MTHRNSRWIHALSVSLLSFGAGAALAETKEPVSPQPTMRAVFQEMKELIPLSLDKDRWSAPEIRGRVLASLDRLERAVDVLERHGRERAAGFNELAINLAGDLRETHERYRRGRYEEARFFLSGTLQNCVACHTRLPSDRSFPLAQELTDRSEMDSLSPRDRAWLLVTVRRFDEALATWESLMRDPAISAAQLDASGVFVDYLNVGIRVRRDLKRVSKSLEAVSKREDLPFYLERRIGDWRAAIAKLDAKHFNESSKPSLERGAALAQEADRIAQGPFGREGLIQDLAAASELVQWLEQDRASRLGVTRNLTAKERADAARAYYWLGVVEARSLDGFWVNLSERHLEAAIRADPHGPLAKKAYALLEENQILGYGGASGVDLPTDVWNLLHELRELIGIKT